MSWAQGISQDKPSYVAEWMGKLNKTTLGNSGSIL